MHNAALPARAQSRQKGIVMYCTGRATEAKGGKFPEFHIVCRVGDKPMGPSLEHIHASHIAGARVFFPLVEQKLLLCGVVKGFVEAEIAGFKRPLRSEKNQDWLRVWLSNVGLVDPKFPARYLVAAATR